MHPAPSVIIFTVFSGLGFGLLFWLGIEHTPPTGWTAFAFWLIAYVMAVGGLMSSTFHLGHPERALKAFTQWRSSWLSREGIAAVATLVLMGLYGLGLVFFGSRMATIGMARGHRGDCDRVHHVDDLRADENHPALEQQSDPRDVPVTVSWRAAHCWQGQRHLGDVVAGRVRCDPVDDLGAGRQSL